MTKRVPTRLSKHGHVRVDDYYWMRDRGDPDLLAFLEAENERARAEMAHTGDLAERLFREITGRIAREDATVPVERAGCWFHQRYEPDGEYPIYCVRRGAPDAREEVMLDANALAAGHEFFNIRAAASPGASVIAYAVDTVGRNFFAIRFRDLASGEDYDDVIPDVTANLVWANDDRTVLYAVQDRDTLRYARIYRHVAGTDPAEDALVYAEPDETFSTWVSKTRSRRFILICSNQTVSDEVRLLDADDPEAALRVVQPRERDHEYVVSHLGDKLYIRTSGGGARNFRLVEAPLDRPGSEHWREVIPHRPDVRLQRAEPFTRHLVVQERRGGVQRLRVIPWDGSGEHEIPLDEQACDVALGPNLEVDTSVVRFSYESLTTPETVYDYDADSRRRVLRKRQPVPGGFDPDDYRSERIQARAPDGVAVPISLVYGRRLERDAASPLLLYGYGSYGASSDPSFSPARLTLLERGFVYAIAHVRGGEELGRRWYDDGKLGRKKNTFTDFIACAEHLVEAGYTSADRLFAMGGSAGGLLVGAVLNLAPDRFAGAVARVPFVDVVSTMLDPGIPLTTSEYDEWGDPNRKEDYDYMLSYSPYDNVAAQDYPPLLVTTSLHDSQVQYWEPAKWVAKLRALKTDSNRLLLKTDLEAGHDGASGRFHHHRDTAFAYAFLLDLAGKAAD